MSLFQTIKDESKRNFIARADEAKDDIVYKYPERNIRMMTQLTVASDEIALFVKDGKVEGKLGPGRHNLDANNVPFVSRLLEKFTGGNLFVAEVFFVSVREFAGIKFGGPIGDVRDPETGLGIGTMVYGNFNISIKEEDEITLKKLSKDVAYTRLAGGFQNYAQGQAMLGAAEGMAKGAMAAARRFRASVWASASTWRPTSPISVPRAVVR